MPQPQEWEITVIQGVPFKLFDLVKGIDGEYVTVASISTIIVKVFDMDDNQIGNPISVTVDASSIFDTVQTAADDAAYADTGGTDGFNFTTMIPGNYTAGNEEQVRVIAYFTDSNGVVSKDPWKATILRVPD